VHPHLTARETEAQSHENLFIAIQLVSGNGQLSFSRQEKKEKGGYGMVIHVCNPSAQSLSQENCEFEHRHQRPPPEPEPVSVHL
jgi:hypothetical protein